MSGVSFFAEKSSICASTETDHILDQQAAKKGQRLQASWRWRRQKASNQMVTQHSKTDEDT
jgi:hypothetical protein